jgi:sirohydrochlorin cobaltochelatase
VKQALILFGHGARDPRWAEPFHKLQTQLQRADPELSVSLAYLELMPPSLLDVITGLADQGFQRVSIVPVFFGQGGHLRKDFPVLLEECRTRFPAIEISATPPVGEWDLVLQSIVAGALQSLK